METIPRTPAQTVADEDQAAAVLLETLTSTCAPPTVGVVGLGVVGLPLAQTLSSAGLITIGVDTDPEKIAAIQPVSNRNASRFDHCNDHGNVNGPGLPTQDWDFLAHSSASPSPSHSPCHFHRHLYPSLSYTPLSRCSAVIACLPTPLSLDGTPDMNPLLSAIRRLAPILSPPVLIIVESTVYPRACETVIKQAIEAAAPHLHRAYFLAHSPERENPGHADGFHPYQIPKLVGGVTPAATTLAAALYRRAGYLNVVTLPSAAVAEAAKLVENVYRSVNIALANELKCALDAMHLDVHAVLDAAATKPFGFQRFSPGAGVGGHCIPVDPHYFLWQASRVGARAPLIELATTVNRSMPAYVVGKVSDALDLAGTPLRTHPSVLILGVAYKPDVDDVREAPAFQIWLQLEKRGASVCYQDDLVPVIPPTAAATMPSSADDVGNRATVNGHGSNVVCSCKKSPTDAAPVMQDPRSALIGNRSVSLEGGRVRTRNFDAVVVVTLHTITRERLSMMLADYEGVVVDTTGALVNNGRYSLYRA